MRIVLLAVALVVALGGTAEARRGGGIVVITSGDEIAHIRDLDAATAAQIGYGKLGYHYDYFGLFWLDLWRSGGEFCVYSGDTYAPITDSELEDLGGASVPWKYHFPPGLLLIAAAIVVGIMVRARRRVKVVYVVAGVMAVLAALFFVKGLDWEFMIPGGIALWLAAAAYFGTKRAREQEALEVAMTPTSARFAAQRASGEQPAVPPSGEHRVRPSDEQRARPSQPNIAGTPPADSRPSQPLVVERPTTQPSSVPMRADDSVDGPKLLR